MYLVKDIIQPAVFLIISLYYIIELLPELLQIICVIIIITLLWNSNRNRLLCIIIFAIPGIGELGKEAIGGLNAQSIIFIFLLLYVFININKDFKKNSFYTIIPILIFCSFHILSYMYGRSISPISVGINEIIKNLRDISFLILASIYIIQNPLPVKEKTRLTNIFIGICILAALIESFNSISSLYFLSIKEWDTLKELNLLENALGVSAAFYLLPLNLLLSRYSSKESNLIIAFIIIILTAIIFSVLRIVIIAALLNVLFWLLKFEKIELRKLIIPTGAIIGLIAIIIYITPIFDSFVYSVNSKESSGIKTVLNINSSGRFEKQWPMAIELWKQKPILGFGHGEIPIRYWFGKTELTDMLDIEIKKIAISTHSIFLESMTDGGVIGFIIILWFIYKISTLLNVKINFSENKSGIYISGLKIFWPFFILVNVFNSWFWVSNVLQTFLILYTIWVGHYIDANEKKNKKLINL